MNKLANILERKDIQETLDYISSIAKDFDKNIERDQEKTLVESLFYVSHILKKLDCNITIKRNFHYNA